MGDKITGSSGSTDVTGLNAKANGAFSHAEGWNTAVTGDQGHAEGHATTAAAFAHAEGYNSSATGTYSHAEGNGTTASGARSHAEGSGSSATGDYAHAEGFNSLAEGYYSHAQGHNAYAPRFAQHSHGCAGANPGAQQAIRMLLVGSTNTAAPVTLLAGAAPLVASGAVTNVLTLPTNRAFRFRLEVAARRTDVTGEFAGFTITGTIVRSSGNVRLISAPTVVADTDAVAAAWTVAVSADTVNQCLAVTATGEAGKTISWVAALYATEVG